MAKPEEHDDRQQQGGQQRARVKPWAAGAGLDGRQAPVADHHEARPRGCRPAFANGLALGRAERRAHARSLAHAAVEGIEEERGIVVAERP